MTSIVLSMAPDRVTSYPADAAKRLANQLQDWDWNLPTDEAEERARDIVIDVTMAVDKLRAIEADESGG